MNPKDLTFDKALEYIARGHAFPKHVEGMETNHMQGVNHFRSNDPSIPDLHIKTPEDLQDYMKRMVDSPDSRGFVVEEDGTRQIHIFNEKDKTYMVFNSSGNDLGTIHRYPNSESNFEYKMGKVQDSPGYKAFDNKLVSGSARNLIENEIVEIQKVPEKNLKSSTLGKALKYEPGEQIAEKAKYQGTKNLEQNGLSEGYKNAVSINATSPHAVPPKSEASSSQAAPAQTPAPTPAEIVAEPTAQTPSEVPPPAPVADNASASPPVEAPKQPDVPSDSSVDQQQQVQTHNDVVDAASKNPDGVAVSPDNKTAVIENPDKTKYQVEAKPDGTSKVTTLDVDGKALSSVDLDVGSTQKLAKSVPELKGVIGNVIGPVIVAGVALASGATPAQAGEAVVDSVIGNTVKAAQQDPTVTGVATGLAKDAAAVVAPEAVEAVNQDKSALEVVGAAAEDGAKWAGCVVGGGIGMAGGGLISSPTVLGVPVVAAAGSVAGCAVGTSVVDQAIDGGKALIGAVVDYFGDEEDVAVAPQGVKSHGTDVSAVLPAGATLTVQSSGGDASVARGVAPDNQIKVMQKDGETSATVTEMDRQRVLEQERTAQLAAQQQQNQQNSPAQLVGR